MQVTAHLHRVVLLIIFVLSAITASHATPQSDENFVKTLPLADLHMHLFGKRPIFYKELMDRNGVKWGGGVGGSADVRHPGEAAVIAIGSAAGALAAGVSGVGGDSVVRGCAWISEGGSGEKGQTEAEEWFHRDSFSR